MASKKKWKKRAKAWKSDTKKIYDDYVREVGELKNLLITKDEIIKSLGERCKGQSEHIASLAKKKEKPQLHLYAGMGAACDYSLLNYAYTNERELVTCPKCLEIVNNGKAGEPG